MVAVYDSPGTDPKSKMNAHDLAAARRLIAQFEDQAVGRQNSTGRLRDNINDENVVRETLELPPFIIDWCAEEQGRVAFLFDCGTHHRLQIARKVCGRHAGTEMQFDGPFELRYAFDLATRALSRFVSEKSTINPGLEPITNKPGFYTSPNSRA